MTTGTRNRRTGGAMSKNERQPGLPFFDLQPTLPMTYATEWLKIHAQVLATMQTMADRWFGHRRQALDALLGAVSKMATCKDPTEFAAAQQQWLAESSEQLSTEIAMLREDALALAQTATASLDAFQDKPSTPTPSPSSKKVA
jgi:hypothetical protein